MQINCIWRASELAVQDCAQIVPSCPNNPRVGATNWRLSTQVIKREQQAAHVAKAAIKGRKKRDLGD